ncbi:hypothetical protein [Frondihabitans sp. VKM Ac-2883]|uniref:hypothetical protein n=1 Tax=Frondihabitans sp. VKM Ac-2883 TaxID=2783823 RepID=UPI00188A0095|nr:hypothetical protein [Frondihabitans sp. VKM Ac-2883]MBF4575195.1 hypothetical protein [Frondihabitans sp. VKM Ac-2883]
MTIGLIVAIAAAIGSGALGALIAWRAQIGVVKQNRRYEAAGHLWEFQRTVNGLAKSSYRSAGYGEDMIVVGPASAADLHEAQKAAYPFASYLPADKRDLIRNPQLGWGGDFGDDLGSAEEVAKSASQLADELELALEGVFKRDSH